MDLGSPRTTIAGLTVGLFRAIPEPLVPSLNTTYEGHMARSGHDSTPDPDNSPGAINAAVNPGEGNSRRFSAFQYRNYRLFFTGQLISVTGTWMQSLAQSYLVYEVLGASPFELGLVNVFQFAPVLLLGIPAGIVADRLPKRNILVVTQSIFALLALVLTVLVALGQAQVWHVYAVATVFGITNAFDMPTRQAFVSEMVGKESVMNAIALNATLFNTGRVLGPAIAGLVLAFFGTAVCFGINAVSYIAVITGLLMMRIKPAKSRAVGSAGARLREGLAYVRATPNIFRPIILVGIVGVFGMNFPVWVPMLASDSFDSGGETYGLLFASMGVGSLVGAFTLAMFGRAPIRRRMLSAAIGLGLVEIILGVGVSIPIPLVMGMVCLAMAGFASSNMMSTANSIVQTTSSEGLRGRVMAVYMTVFAGTAPFGSLVTGAIADRFGVGMSLGLCGMVTFIATIIIIWAQRDRTIIASHAATVQGS